MKRSFMVPVLAVTLFVAATGCIEDGASVPPHAGDIVLGVEGLSHGGAASRAALDEWENTEVSVGYMFAATQSVFDRSLTVTVEDAGPIAAENDGQRIETGMAYPEDNSAVSFRGYHPVAAPTAAGTVTYDISKGDVDVMLSNVATGTLAAPIAQKLKFEHQLTRVTFKLRCARNKSYPEPVFGVRATSATATPLMTAVTLKLDSPTPAAFKAPGGVLCGDLAGFVIPQYGEDWQVVDVMVQPDVPLAFSVASLTGNRTITVTGDPGGWWAQLTSVGGRRGVRYTVQLEFGGESILAQQITATEWVDGDRNLGDNSGEWW